MLKDVCIHLWQCNRLRTLLTSASWMHLLIDQWKEWKENGSHIKLLTTRFVGFMNNRVMVCGNGRRCFVVLCFLWTPQVKRFHRVQEKEDISATDISQTPKKFLMEKPELALGMNCLFKTEALWSSVKLSDCYGFIQWAFVSIPSRDPADTVLGEETFNW